MNIDKSNPELLDKLQQITKLVDSFNRSSDKFRLELHVNKNNFEGYLSLEDIMDRVCRKSGLTPEYLNMKSREPNIIVPRQICHYMAVKRSKHSSGQIGWFFGKKDHATVLHSVKTIQDRLDTDKNFRKEWYEFLNK